MVIKKNRVCFWKLGLTKIGIIVRKSFSGEKMQVVPETTYPYIPNEWLKRHLTLSNNNIILKKTLQTTAGELQQSPVENCANKLRPDGERPARVTRQSIGDLLYPPTYASTFIIIYLLFFLWIDNKTFYWTISSSSCMVRSSTRRSRSLNEINMAKTNHIIVTATNTLMNVTWQWNIRKHSPLHRCE